MKNLTKLITVLLVLTMMFTLAACGKGSDPAVASPTGNEPSGTATATPDGSAQSVDKDLYPSDKRWEILEVKNAEPVNITMWIPNSATSTMGAAIGELADQYNREQADSHPGKNITVTVEYQDTSGALNTKLQAAILANNNPVISAVGVSSVPLYESRAIDLRTVYTYEELQGLNQGLLQYSLYNGKFMLNPYFPSASNIIVANKTLIETKGFMLPTPESITDDPENSNWTWDEFKKIAVGVTSVDATDDAKSVYGFASGSVDPVGMMFQQGGKLYNDTVTTIEFDKDDKIKTGLEFWRSLVTDKAMRNPNSRANHGTVITSEFYTGNVGMIFTTSSNLATMTTKAKEAGFEIEVLPFPKKTNFFTNQGGSGIILLDNKPKAEIEAGADFLRWLTQPQNVAHMCAKSGYLPVNPKATGEAELAAIYQEIPVLKTAAEYMQFGIRSPQGKAKAAADKKVNDYAKQIWSEPDKSIEAIVKELIDEATYEIEANQ
ncbi:MAG TPA: hypothetical protein DEB10_01790 [Ruminococcaceae bacterium]|jgi:ABC-type glycerol-3-phosphate transport system substrate-binding protein|nr:hypothetical protein [Ruminiclostridium sp.]HBT63378.1 hypothetical protein [Oscillospiraceae bacterium]